MQLKSVGSIAIALEKIGDASNNIDIVSDAISGLSKENT